ncbi:hypothetical protein [Hankyongella ginsenosidimutans]|uniref:hypothetical protein n=1 Tax=Hankyongella ginsenosidimutans TaxID=1763828 RepID=UPI001CA33961|nr:hypothetical protein [Hankyongella ginsenosidimutans]
MRLRGACMIFDIVNEFIEVLMPVAGARPDFRRPVLSLFNATGSLRKILHD